jgi:hypothetical protein
VEYARALSPRRVCVCCEAADRLRVGAAPTVRVLRVIDRRTFHIGFEIGAVMEIVDARQL